ncbi:MAG: CopG family transcriptional regulator [Ancrocorticia sp.]|uniref:ribbon-helix-helix domain-containing protein n=1 Tax=Ancrocorticia sp. TaxID=2593684 RepID=UPI003F8F3599
MKTYKDVNGTEFTEEDIERWAADAEADVPYTGEHYGPPTPGRPVSVGTEAKPFTLRLDRERRSKLDAAAHDRHVTPSQLVRDLIDTL